MRPSVWVLLSTYKAIFSAATSQGIHLDSQFLVEDLWQTVEDDGYPLPLVEALLARLAPEGQPIGGKCKFPESA
jgi:sister chromatid cohesion protein DCC1